MSTPYSNSQSHRLPSSDRVSSFTIGLTVLLCARVADIATTIYGIRVAGLIETHPVVAAAMTQIGIVPALVLLGALSVAVLVAGVELAAAKAATIDPQWPPVVRLVGYGLGTALYFGAAAWNLYLIGRVM